VEVDDTTSNQFQIREEEVQKIQRSTEFQDTAYWVGMRFCYAFICSGLSILVLYASLSTFENCLDYFERDESALIFVLFLFVISLTWPWIYFFFVF